MTPQHRRATTPSAVDASFAEVTEAPKSEVTTSPIASGAAGWLAASIATIRVNTKSAEGAKAALLLLLGTVLLLVLLLASAFSQPFFCFEGQHPPRQQGVDDLTPAAATALNAAASACLA